MLVANFQLTLISRRHFRGPPLLLRRTCSRQRALTRCPGPRRMADPGESGTGDRIRRRRVPARRPGCRHRLSVPARLDRSWRWLMLRGRGLGRDTAKSVAEDGRRRHRSAGACATWLGGFETTPADSKKKVKAARTRLPSVGSGPDSGSCSQPAGDVSHKPGGRLTLLSARPAVTLATLKRAADNFAAW